MSHALKYLRFNNLNFKCDSRIRSYSKVIKGSICPTEDQQKTTSAFHRYKKIMDVPEGIFKGMSDRFNGVTVDSIQEYNDDDNFANKLEKSLDFWKNNKFRGIWFKVHTENADWVSSLAKKGFDFHHAKKGYVMMYKWLPTDEYENIPVFAHTMIGVGGLVINGKNEVLVVSDRYALIPNSWKLPGGYAEPSENLIDAAVREVQEETGILAEFKTLVSIRHSHGGGFGCSDIYVVIGLIPKSEKIIPCQREIAKCEWMPVDEYLNHPNVHETNRQFVETFLLYKKHGIRINCEERVHRVLQKKYNLYSAKIEESNQ